MNNSPLLLLPLPFQPSSDLRLLVVVLAVVVAMRGEGDGGKLKLFPTLMLRCIRPPPPPPPVTVVVVVEVLPIGLMRRGEALVDGAAVAVALVNRT